MCKDSKYDIELLSISGISEGYSSEDSIVLSPFIMTNCNNNSKPSLKFIISNWGVRDKRLRYTLRTDWIREVLVSLFIK